MCSHCENCELLLKIEEERLQWCKQLTIKNIQMHKRLNENEKLIQILKNQLLEKRAYVVSEYVGDVMYDLKEIINNKDLQHDTYLQKCLNEKLEEMDEFMNIFQSQRESFQIELEENEKYYSDNIAYLSEVVNYFRESLFEEMEKSNRIKQYFLEKFSHEKMRSNHIILSTLKEEGERIYKEMKQRYRETIERSRNDIERQNSLILKLKHHTRQLYIQMCKNRKESEEKIVIFEQTIKDLNFTVKKLREKNNNLHTQIKLEVEGCCHDIQDTRKKLRHILESNK